MKITKKIAENFLSNRYDDGLRDFTLIEDAAAELLVQHAIAMNDQYMKDSMAKPAEAWADWIRDKSLLRKGEALSEYAI